MKDDLDLDLDDDATIGLEDDEAFDASLIVEGDETGGATDLPVARLVGATADVAASTATRMKTREDAEAPASARPGSPESPESSESSGARRKPSWAGKKLGKFLLQRLLGEGSMGRVIQAEDVHLHRLVALKVLRKKIEGVDGHKQVEQFLREARAAAQIDHPNIVRIHEINEVDGWWYIAMEYIEGDTLTRVVKASGPMRPDRACAVIADAASALSVAHDLGIIHRDVKPNNLMITRSGRCKLTDFGLVRVDDPSDPFHFTDKSVGTPQYMPPEIIQHKEQTPAVDVYSLGGTLYFALTGRPPYVGKTVMKLLKKQLESPPPDPRDVVPRCPEGLAKLVMRAMAKRPEERPTAADFAAALRAESIDYRHDESSIASGLYAMPAGMMQSAAGSHTTILAPAPKTWRTRLRFVAMLILAAAVGASGLYILDELNIWSIVRDNVTQESYETLGGQPMEGAQESWGFRDSIPNTNPLPQPPAFSWYGKVDTTGIRFVASNTGNHYYPIDHPRAILIRADQFVGYPTEQAARDDGKTPFVPRFESH